MDAAGDSAGALPPFNLSCQVRRRCVSSCTELAVEAQADWWRQLLNTAATRKPSRAFHAGLFVDLLTRFTRLSFVLRGLRVQEGALWVSGEPCSCAPAKLAAVPFFGSATKWQLLFLHPPPSSSSCKQQLCLFLAVRATHGLQLPPGVGGACPACWPRTPPFKPHLTQDHHPALFQPHQ